METTALKWNLGVQWLRKTLNTMRVTTLAPWLVFLIRVIQPISIAGCLENKGLKAMIDIVVGGHNKLSSMPGSVTGMDDRAKKIDRQKFELMLEELQFDLEAWKVYSESMLSYKSKLVFEEQAWKKKVWESASDACTSWLDAHVVWPHSLWAGLWHFVALMTAALSISKDHIT